MTRKQRWLVGVGIGALGGAVALAAYLTTARRHAPTCVAGVTLGVGYTCVLFQNGRVRCHGVPGYDRDLVETGARFSKIAAGFARTCGLSQSDGAIWCWDSHGDVPRPPWRVDVLGARFTDVQVVLGLVCGLRDGEVWCQRLDQRQVTLALRDVAAFAMRGHHACAVMRSGEVQCWGSNLSGELGRGTVSKANLGDWSEPPAPVAGLDARVTALRLSDTTSCAVTDDGSVWCWGFAGNGELADGRYWDGKTSLDPFLRSRPVRLELPVKVRDLALGDASCAVASDGTVWCWGHASFGAMLGKPSVSFSRDLELAEIEPRPRRLEALGADNQRVFAGQTHYCVQKTDLSIWCWGDNNRGQVERTPTAGAAFATRLPVVCPPD